MISTKTSSLFPKQGDQNAKRTEKHIDKEQGKTKHEVPRSVNYRATQNKNNIGTTALERSVVYTTGGGGGEGGLKAFHSTNFTLGPDIILNTKNLFPQPTPNCGSSCENSLVQYSSRVFSLSHPSQWGRLFYPLQSHSRLHSNITCNFMTCAL